jgi:hypothetical protein
MGSALALLQGLAGGFLVLLFFALLGGGLLLAAVFGRAFGRRGPDRPVGRFGRGLLPGRILCSVGLALAVTGAIFVDIATDVVGMLLGATGYYLGARVFGTILIILSTATLFIGLLAGQGAIPGSYEELMSGYTPRH